MSANSSRDRARFELLDQVLQYWAIWRSRGMDGLGYSGESSIAELTPGAPEYSSFVPHYFMSEGDLLDEAISALDERLRKPIVYQYCWVGLAQYKARACGCSTATYYSRLYQARTMLLDDERVQKFFHAARPTA